MLEELTKTFLVYLLKCQKAKMAQFDLKMERPILYLKQAHKRSKDSMLGCESRWPQLVRNNVVLGGVKLSAIRDKSQHLGNIQNCRSHHATVKFEEIKGSQKARAA